MIQKNQLRGYVVYGFSNQEKSTRVGKIDSGRSGFRCRIGIGFVSIHPLVCTTEERVKFGPILRENRDSVSESDDFGGFSGGETVLF